ncbi:hypothetical protein JCM11641_000826 [Rhodosporidiobolus odoratus]
MSAAGPSAATPVPSSSSATSRKRVRSGSDAAGGPSQSGGSARSNKRTASERQLAASAQAARTSGTEDSDDEPSSEQEGDSDAEPDTEDEDEELQVAVALAPARGGDYRYDSHADGPSVLDLTDESTDAASSPVAGPSFASHHQPIPLPRRPGATGFGAGSASLTLDDSSSSSSSSDEENPRASPASRKNKPDAKGKGRALPSSSPRPPSNSVASASASASTNADSDALPTLNHLTCPICFGAPTPLALTACGHAFCAPCLHASLVAGPALSPPPPGGAGAGRGSARRGGSAGVNEARLFNRGRGSPARGGRGGGRTLGGAGAGHGDEDEGDPELNKHCPVCRTALYGGWGKSLRGLVLRMGTSTMSHNLTVESERVYELDEQGNTIAEKGAYNRVQAGFKAASHNPTLSEDKREEAQQTLDDLHAQHDDADAKPASKKKTGQSGDAYDPSAEDA